MWNFNDDFARNVIIFGVDNSSSSHLDNIKNVFLILGEGDTFGINRSLAAPGKLFNINFRKAKTKFCLSFHYNDENCYLFVNGKEINKSKASNKNVNFPSQYCLGSISNKFESEEVKSEDVSFIGNLYDFSVDYDVIDKCNISNIHKYLMIENSILNVWIY